jgi:hypothetical protein
MASEKCNSFQLTLRVRKPLTSYEQMGHQLNDEWLQAVSELLTRQEDGKYPWQGYELGDGTPIRFKSLQEYISSDDGLRTSPTRMLKLLEADPLPGASEIAEKLLDALTPNGGDRRSEAIRLDNVKADGKASYASGNSKARLIREIRQLSESDAPNAILAADLLTRVHRSEISANKAAVQLGLRNRVVNFDLNKLTPEVRSEIDNIKEQEDWTTAEVLEEALRAYFRVLNADEPEDLVVAPAAPQPKLVQQRQAPVAVANGKKGPKEPPEGFIKGVDVADICGYNRNSLGYLVNTAHDANKDAELATKDGSRLFIRRIGQKFWEEVK